MLGDTNRDRILVREDAGKRRAFGPMTQTYDRDAGTLGCFAQVQIHASSQDSISGPSREPGRIRIILATFRRKNRPGTVEAHVFGDAAQDFSSIDLRGLDDQ